jgi:hypothetical protein
MAGKGGKALGSIDSLVEERAEGRALDRPERRRASHKRPHNTAGKSRSRNDEGITLSTLAPARSGSSYGANNARCHISRNFS